MRKIERNFQVLLGRFPEFDKSSKMIGFAIGVILRNKFIQIDTELMLEERESANEKKLA